MKTNKILPGFLMSVLLLITHMLFAQDVSINITALQPSILNFTVGELEVKLCNEDAEPITAPANKLRPQISFPDNLTIKEVVNSDGSPLTNFTIQSLVNDPGNHTVRLLYNTTLANADCIAFNIRFAGNAVGTGIITATLGFQGPPTLGNNPANDNSTGSTPVDENLPVTLKEFDAKAEGSIALLTWSTTEEINSDHFDVQRSKDGKQWNTFQTVAAQGDSKSLNTYSATDREPLDGENLYRLHMIDNDGTSAYSRIRELNFQGDPIVMLPNPVTSTLTLKVTDWEKVNHVSILDTNGLEVYNSASKLTNAIDVSNLKPGIYIVQVRNKNGAAHNQKIVVSK